MSNSLQPHEQQHTRLPCPSLSPRVCSNSCPLSWWCHPTISTSVITFSSCPQSFPTSGSFPMSWLFASGGYSIGASASASVLPMNIQSWFPLGLTGLISVQSKGLSNIFYRTTIRKHQFFGVQPSLWSNSHICTWDHLHWDQQNQKFITNSRIFSPRCLNWWICLLFALSIQCSLNNYSSLNYLFNYSEHTTAPFISIWDYRDDNKPSWKMAFKILAP